MRKGAGFRYLLMAAVVMAAPASVARADDDPGRGVARISVINGDVSVRRGDSGDWVAAAVNAPLVGDDAVATGPTSRAEVQFDYANMLRLGPDSEVRISELEYRRYQLQVARGTVEFRVLRNSDADVDVSTPAVSVRPQKKGAYRITVRDDGETEVTVRSGEVEIYTPRGVEQLHSGQTMLARTTANGPEFQMANASPMDEFDRWNQDRDRALERSASYRYVSPTVYGAEDLDGYGRWVYDPPYGWVWAPTSMGPGWAPYSRGRWVWEDWYGWTWVSADPWGWAPYHYGRWYHGRVGWCWYPGGIGVRHYWSPALVAFFGFGAGNVHVGLGFGRVGWVPLAPHEPYYPWYGRGYYGGYRGGGYVDRSVHITNVNIINTYRNARIRNGMSGVDAGSFGRGGHNVYRVSRNEIHQAGLVRGQLPLAPDRSSLRLADREVRNMPRGGGNTQFYTRRQAAQVERVPFAEQQRSFQRAAQVPAGGAGMPGRTGSGAANKGWRRIGEPSQGMQGGQQVRGPSPARNGDPGWRRFGGDSGTRGQSPAAQPAERGASMRNPEQARPGRTVDSGNWRRFGEPTQRREQTPRQQAPHQMEQAPRQMEQAPRQMEQAPRQMEQPRTREQQAPRSEPRQVRQNQGGTARSWDRFGDPQRNTFNGGATAARTRGADAPSVGRSGRQESLPIASPVVRERSMPRSESAPRVERQSYGGSPRMESAPRNSGGGGARSESRHSGGGARGGSGRGGRR